MYRWDRKGMPTFLPASLLCRFMRARALFILGFELRAALKSRASTKVLANAIPNAMLSLQPSNKHIIRWKDGSNCEVLPAHWNPCAGVMAMVRSQPHFKIWPFEQNLVTAWAIPALEIAWMKAASRVPKYKDRLLFTKLSLNSWKSVKSDD